MKIEGETSGLALGFVGVLRFAEEGEVDWELAGGEAFLGGAVAGGWSEKKHPVDVSIAKRRTEKEAGGEAVRFI